MPNVINVPTCPVCKSKLRKLIEGLSIQGLTPDRIYDHLMTNDNEMRERATEDKIKPSNIRKHLDRHFDRRETESVNLVDTEYRIQQARENYYQGRAKTINKINVLNLQIDTALAKMESLDNLKDAKTNHDLTIKYMTTIKGLIESLAKLTGDLKQEGTIDVAFFGNEITKFAEMVTLAIRRVDKNLSMGGKLEDLFAAEFVKLWDDYITLQNKKLNNEVPVDYGNYSINTFNETEL